MEYKDDGEIHALEGDWAYILKKTPPLSTDSMSRELRRFQKEAFNKYAEYLYSFDKKEVIEIIIEMLSQCLPFGTTFERDNISFTYRPPELCGALALHGSFGFKFKRSQNDNLSPPKDECCY